MFSLEFPRPTSFFTRHNFLSFMSLAHQRVDRRCDEGLLLLHLYGFCISLHQAHFLPFFLALHMKSCLFSMRLSPTPRFTSQMLEKCRSLLPMPSSRFSRTFFCKAVTPSSIEFSIYRTSVWFGRATPSVDRLTLCLCCARL